MERYVSSSEFVWSKRKFEIHKQSHLSLLSAHVKSFTVYPITSGNMASTSLQMILVILYHDKSVMMTQMKDWVALASHYNYGSCVL